MSKATISTKGHLIDIHCQHNTGQLVDFNGSVYSCTLNQTDIGSNKNKFYIMQLIKIMNKYVLYIRFGRIGETGKIIENEYDSKESAILSFEKQFRTKTGNSWINRKDFVKKNKKYYMADIECVDVESDKDSSDESSDTSDTSDTSTDDEKLSDSVISLLKLISNTTYMKNTLVQLEIDVEKMPLGKISQGQIDNAYEILNNILSNINKLKNNDEIDFVKLSSEFYTLIPYACGRQKPPIINNQKRVAKNINLLNELSQMVFGTKAVIKLKKEKGNLMKLYHDLHTEINPLDDDDEMYIILENYLKDSMAVEHNFKFNILNIFEINREFEKDMYNNYSSKITNKTLLFHGTRVPNIISVLQNGLLVDPSKLGINVSITGKMFGLGLYFSPCSTKSLNYCSHESSDNIACLFVAEVALGHILKKTDADVSLTAKTIPKGYHSTRGIGQKSFTNYDLYEDGIKIPNGKLKLIPKNSKSILRYDEYIVYHEEQINLKYLIQLKIND